MSENKRYNPETWENREGTNLNKYTKSSETGSSVILTNSPDSITQAGTPFTTARMNNLERGVSQSTEQRFWNLRGISGYTDAGLGPTESVVFSDTVYSSSFSVSLLVVGTYQTSGQGYVYISYDYGKTFEKKAVGTARIYGIIINITGIFVVCGSGIYRSIVTNNVAADFTQVSSNTMAGGIIYIDQGESGILLASSASYVLESDETGTTWSIASTDLSGSVSSFCQTSSGRIFAGTSSDLWYSDDNGASWTATLVAWNIRGIIESSDHGHLYVVTDSNVFGSNSYELDPTSGWSGVTSNYFNGEEVRSIVERESGKYVAFGSDELWYSNDDMSTWTNDTDFSGLADGGAASVAEMNGVIVVPCTSAGDDAVYCVFDDNFYFDYTRLWNGGYRVSGYKLIDPTVSGAGGMYSGITTDGWYNIFHLAPAVTEGSSLDNDDCSIIAVPYSLLDDFTVPAGYVSASHVSTIKMTSAVFEDDILIKDSSVYCDYTTHKVYDDTVQTTNELIDFTGYCPINSRELTVFARSSSTDDTAIQITKKSLLYTTIRADTRASMYESFILRDSEGVGIYGDSAVAWRLYLSSYKVKLL